MKFINIQTKINRLAQRLKREGKKLLYVKVFANCLHLTFEKGRSTFYSKEGLNYGDCGLSYIPSIQLEKTFNVLNNKYKSNKDKIEELKIIYYKTKQWYPKIMCVFTGIFNREVEWLL